MSASIIYKCIASMACKKSKMLYLSPEPYMSMSIAGAIGSYHIGLPVLNACNDSKSVSPPFNIGSSFLESQFEAEILGRFEWEYF